jgi:serine/threonine protein kinase
LIKVEGIGEEVQMGNERCVETQILERFVWKEKGITMAESSEFLEACRDFIKAHRSLYYDGKILHRDISENNIIVTDAGGEGDPRGMLIDLDLAKELNSGPSGARHRTGTMEFMAIEVLEGRAHIYRHDIESFFYVFLWVIIRYGQETGGGLPKTSQLRD